MPIGRLITCGGMDNIREFYEQLGDDYIKALDDMIVFEALICNVDRDFGNFGFLVDNRTNKIVSTAPLFDHGKSLFNFAGREDLETEESLSAYVQILLPCVYDDFIGSAKKVLTSRHREGLRKLLDFKFKKHSKYNLSDKRLMLPLLKSIPSKTNS